MSNLLGTLWLGMALVLAVAVWHRLRGRRREALAWILVGLSTYVLQEGLKALTARPRPQLWPWLVHPTSSAFPSGHALASATFYPLLAWTLARLGVADRRCLMAAGAALAAYVGIGRLYLGVHWPSDVLAGWSLGALQAWLAIRWLARHGEAAAGSATRAPAAEP